MTQEQIDKFLAGLAKLSEETGIVIAGCGCCDSPWLGDLADSEQYYIKKLRRPIEYKADARGGCVAPKEKE